MDFYEKFRKTEKKKKEIHKNIFEVFSAVF